MQQSTRLASPQVSAPKTEVDHALTDKAPTDD
jgi:hypothetical protein